MNEPTIRGRLGMGLSTFYVEGNIGLLRFLGSLKALVLFVVLSLTLPLILLPSMSTPTHAQGDCRLFTETNKTVCGAFIQYWEQHGGLSQQGYPISGEIQEISDTDGKVYMVQYFERAVFELHPENQPPNNVLLSLLGVFRYDQKYPNGAFDQRTSTTNPYKFPQTGKTVGGKFRLYWEQHGGLSQQGYPISDEFVEKSDLDGKSYMVQYFERAVFELHPENQPPFDVLLSQLGKFRYDDKYNVPAKPSPTPGPSPTPLPSPTCYNFFMRPGTIIAQGTNTEPSGFRNLKTYRVEEVILPASLTCNVLVPDPTSNRLVQQMITFDKFWHLIVTGGPFQEGGGDALTIWLDDTLIGNSSPSVPGELRTLVYDRTYLREGAAISVGEGFAPSPREFLRETLHFSRTP